MSNKPERMRLDKLLSHLGQGSRSAVRAMIQAGRVQVNGACMRDAGHTLDAENDNVLLDGEPLAYQRHLLLMLHKPAGVITAADDPRHKTVMDLLPLRYRASGCMPVGRLDRDTEGLLLLTNDGVLAHRILAPKSQVDKVYFARVDGELTEADVEAFAQGIRLKDFDALPAQLNILSADTAEVTVQEGKYHQVKRMFQARGRQVLYLKRLSIGPIVLDEALVLGEYRDLTQQETAALLAACGGEHA